MEKESLRSASPAAHPLKRNIAKYLVVCSALTLLNLYTGGAFWVSWVWVAWGAALILRAVCAPDLAEEDENPSGTNPRRAFYRHLCSYLYVIGILALVNYLYTPAYPWVVWPAAGWGLGIALQAVDVFCGGDQRRSH